MGGAGSSRSSQYLKGVQLCPSLVQQFLTVQDYIESGAKARAYYIAALSYSSVVGVLMSERYFVSGLRGVRISSIFSNTVW